MPPTDMSKLSADTRRLAALDHAHVWHPFTPMTPWRECDPLIIKRANGCELIDTEGNRYIDGASSLWCNVHGHCVPQINRAIRDQLDKVAHTTLLGLSSPPSIELASRLSQIAPGSLRKVFYSDAGATALEVAFKMAVGYWYHTGQRKKDTFIGFKGAYHGDTTGAMSVGFSELFHRPFGSMLFPTMFAPMPDTCHPPPQMHTAADTAPCRGNVWPSEDRQLGDVLRDHCLAELNRILVRQADQIAAIVIEPIMQGAAGMVCQPPGFLRSIADLAKKHDALLIADEVATGFGRTGTLFACEHENVEPDIMCLAKGISGGYLPLAATLVTDRIEQAFAGAIHERKTLYHGHTYTGNALGCAAALASLDLFDSSSLLEHINRSAKIVTNRLDVLRDPASFPHVLDVRQRGLMIGIELCEDRTTHRPLDPAQHHGASLCTAMRSKGLILRPLGDVIVLMPIPAMPHPMLHRMLDIVVQTILGWTFD